MIKKIPITSGDDSIGYRLRSIPQIRYASLKMSIQNELGNFKK